MTALNSRNGYHPRQRLSLLGRARFFKNKPSVTGDYGAILDLRTLKLQYDTVSVMRLVREFFSFKEMVELLVQEPHLPREYPYIMDAIVDEIDKDTKYAEELEGNSLEVLSIVLEQIQLDLDERILRKLPEHQVSKQYEVKRWLSDTTAIVVIETLKSHS